MIHCYVSTLCMYMHMFSKVTDLGKSEIYCWSISLNQLELD